MKKSLGFILTIVMAANLLVGLSSAVSFAADVNSHQDHFSCQNFESVDTKKYDNGLWGMDEIFFDSEVDGTLNLKDAGFTMYQYGSSYPNLQVCDSYTEPEQHGKSMVLRLTTTGFTGDNTTALKLQYSGFADLSGLEKYVYKMDLNLDNWFEESGKAQWRFYTNSAAQDSDTPLFEIKAGELVYYSGGDTPVSTSFTVTEDAWEHYYLVIDQVNHTHSLYHGTQGTPLYENASIPGNTTDPLVIIGTRRLGYNSSESLWMDNFCVYEYDESSIPNAGHPLVTPTPKPTPEPTPTPTPDPGATPRPDGTQYIPNGRYNWMDTFENGDISGYAVDSGSNLREVTFDPEGTRTDHVYHIQKNLAGGSKTMRWYTDENSAIFSGYATTQFQARVNGSTDFEYDTWEFKLRTDPYDEISLMSFHTAPNGTVILRANNGGTSEDIDLYTIKQNAWHTYSIAMSQELGTWKLFVDGKIVKDNIAFEKDTAASRKFHAFYIISNHPNSLGNEIWLDNVCGYFGLPAVPDTELPDPTPPPEGTPVPTPFPQTTAKPAGENNLTVAFLGGSITEGIGANNLSSGYAGQVGNWFQNKFLDKNVTIINAGFGGTGSNFGMFRTKTQVIDQNPDIVFVEFAVNDYDYDANTAKQYMEGIVRTFQNCEKTPKIVFLYTTKYNGSSFVDQAQAHQEIADYYRIPSIDVGAVLEAKVQSGTSVNSLLGDWVHPTQAGHDLYAKTIIDLLESDYDQTIQDFTKKTEPYVAGNQVYQPRTVSAATTVQQTGVWSKTVHQDGSGSPATRMNVLKSSEPGAVLETTFYGKYIGMSYVMSGQGGSISYYIDGVKAGTFNTYYNIDYQKATSTIFRDNLKEGWHTLKIVVDNMLVADANAAVSIGDLLVDDGKAIQTMPEYLYRIDGMTFQTSSGETIAKPKNGDFSVLVNLTNQAAGHMTAALIVTAYDESGQMVGYDIVPASVATTKEIKAELSVASGKTIHTIKAFVWESENEVFPISKYFAQ